MYGGKRLCYTRFAPFRRLWRLRAVEALNGKGFRGGSSRLRAADFSDHKHDPSGAECCHPAAFGRLTFRIIAYPYQPARNLSRLRAADISVNQCHLLPPQAYAAAFGRLTFRGDVIGKGGETIRSAAFGRLCVETGNQTTVTKNANVSRPRAAVC